MDREPSTQETVASESPHSATAPLRGETIALAAGSNVGRYVVLSRLGAGAMGVVFAAYDPELDRKVALKILRPRGNAETARARLAREAQALARVSHPNVVAVHDVGSFGEHLFVAMEFVEGQTLGDWVADEERDAATILDTFLRAARGLSAAHEAGLVHRDFKPDNVMVDVRGRVRVMDFGLARASDSAVTESNPELAELSSSNSGSSLGQSLTRTGAVLGTPAYMAPEQHMGMVADALSDQFSFCVTLYEALYDERPFAGGTLSALALAVTSGDVRTPPSGSSVPAHIWPVLQRGLSVDPKKRFPSMAALSEALAVDPRAKRRQVYFGVGTVAALGAVIALSRMSAGAQDDPCASASQAFASSWNAQRADQLESALTFPDAAFTQASAAKTRAQLDAYATRWTQLRVDTCQASLVRHEQSADMMDRKVACLDGRRQSFDALVSVLSEADLDVASEAVGASARLPMLEPCVDTAALLARVPPPSDPQVAEAVTQLDGELAKAAALENAGRYEAGFELAEQAWTQAQGIDYLPIQARAAWRLGSIEEALARNDDAMQHLAKAHWLATAAGDSEHAARSAAYLGYLHAQHRRNKESAADWSELARANAQRLERPPRLWATVINEQGEMEGANTNYKAAVELHREALRTLEAHGAPGVATTLQSLARALNQTAEYDEALATIERAITLLSSELGAEHPKVAKAKGTQAHILHRRGEYDRALEIQREAVQGLQAALGPGHVSTGDALINLGTMLQTKGEIDEAQAAYEAARVAFESGTGEHKHQVALALDGMGVLAYMRGDLEGAVKLFEESIAITEAKLGKMDPSLTNTLSNYSAILSVLGRNEEALPIATQVLEIERTLRGPGHPLVAFAHEQRGSIYRKVQRSEDARRDFERAIDIYDQVHGPHHASSGNAWSGLANLALESGDEAQALELLETALRCYGEPEEFRSKRGQAQLQMAKLLWKDRARRDEARKLAKLARAEFIEVGARGEQYLAELDDWERTRR